MISLTFYVPQAEGGRKKIILDLEKILSKKVESHLVFDKTFTNSKHFSFLYLFFQKIAYWKKVSDNQKSSTLVCCDYYQMVGASFSQFSGKKIFYFHGEDTFDPDVLKKKYSTSKLKLWYSLLIHSLILLLHKISYHRSDVLIVPSSYSKSYLMSKYHLPQTKIVIVKNGIDNQFFSPLSKVEKSKLKKKLQIKNPVISYIGRVDYKKGVSELIQGFAHLENKHLLLHIICPQPNSIQKEYLANALISVEEIARNRIEVITDPTSVKTYIHISECLVLPSLTEHLPLTFLESAACGVPMIATQVGELKTLLPKVDPSLILKDTHPKTISQTITRYLNASQNKKNAIKRELISLASQFSLEKTAEDFVSVIQRTTN